MRKPIVTAIVSLAVLFAAACGSSSKSTTHTTTPAPSTTSTTSTGSSSSSGSVTVAAKSIKPFGTVLVNSSGHALYTFAPDNAQKVTCTGSCAKIWPPLTLPAGAKPAASGGARSSLLGSDPNPGGGRVVTYNGWPLYTYITDTAAGVAHGQALNLNGGFWYLISSSGTVVKSKG